MHMTRHDDPGIDFQSFFFLAVFPAFKKYVFVFISYKNINPENGGETDKINAFRIVEFIFTAQLRIGFGYRGKFR